MGLSEAVAWYKMLETLESEGSKPALVDVEFEGMFSSKLKISYNAKSNGCDKQTRTSQYLSN